MNTHNITSGDIIGSSLSSSDIQGDVFVWHDILYEGRKFSGILSEEQMKYRAELLSDFTAGGLSVKTCLDTLRKQYDLITNLNNESKIILWFDGCLFDQSMLAHILTCFHQIQVTEIELICINQYPGVNPFNGLGQLHPEQLSTLLRKKVKVSEEQYLFAQRIDKAFAKNDISELRQISNIENALLEFAPTAIQRYLEEIPKNNDDLGKLHRLILAAVDSGKQKPLDIFHYVANADTPPIFWGDTTLWLKINQLARKVNPKIKIEGPAEFLPQWESELKVNEFNINLV